jgi:S1-C subfamily serine protease
VPVFFISTGAHRDYHTPLDDIEFIDGKMAEKVASFSAELVSLVADMETPLTFQRTSSENKGARRSMRLKVTFGIMPDMVSQTTDGLGVDGVRPGGPADKAGMKTGDRIVAINGEKVTDIYNYMHRLGKLEPGETAVVEVVRDGENEILLIQL